MQVKRMLNGRCASVQRAAEHPPVVRRTAPSNMRIKLTAKLKSLSAFSLLAAYPPPVRWTPTLGCLREKMKTLEEKSLVYRTVKERYLWEHDRKNELNNIISIPLGLMSILIGCLAYFFNNQPKNSDTLLFILYHIFITISIVCLIFCLYCFYFQQTGYTYCYISSPDKLLEYEQNYIKNFNDNKLEVDYNGHL